MAKKNNKSQLDIKFEIQDLEFSLQKMQEQQVNHKSEVKRLGQEIPKIKERIMDKVHELMEGIE